jgi:C1A family cysteine protease
MPQKIQRYGWIPDIPDQRDHLFSAPVLAPQDLPAKIDLSSQCPPVYDQGQLGSCTANAIAAAFEFTELKEQQQSEFRPSRLFIYYNERLMEGTINSDSGAQIRDGIKSVATVGVCPEPDWLTTSLTSARNRPTAATRPRGSTRSSAIYGLPRA